MAKEIDVDRKKIFNLEKFIKLFEKRIKVLIGLVCGVCVMNIIILTMLMTKPLCVVKACIVVDRGVCVVYVIFQNQ